MRVTRREVDNRSYWENRWEHLAADQPMTNTTVYPLRYALAAVSGREGRILEAGCGAGRVLRYFHDRGFDIVGIDFIEAVVSKLRTVDPRLKVEVGDICHLRFPDGHFRYVLAFGLYHNLERGLEQALKETCRVMEPGGRLCASFRADNIQTRLVDWLSERRSGGGNRPARSCFHKLNLTRSEFVRLVEKAGFSLETAASVENMPLLYKFRLFRAPGHKRFDEENARREGYRLSRVGGVLQRLLMKALPDQFCNLYVLVAVKRQPA